jgi:3-phosphoshikimate 1-carboxyvinyltransferase
MLALAGKGELKLKGLKKSGLQGDQEVAVIFSKLGIVTRETKDGLAISSNGEASDGFTLDFDSHPDLALPVIMACCATYAHVEFTGLERLRDKESDRLQAITSNLSGLGIRLEETFPGLWRSSGQLISPRIIQPEVYNDHRVAMTMACLAAGGFTVHLEHPEVVNKSYPGFWKDLENTGFSCYKSC